MPRYKRWFPVSQDINSDPEGWELTTVFGDRAFRTWMEILSILERTENRWRLSGAWLDSLSRKVRQKPATVQRTIGWMLANHWLEAGELLTDGSPAVLSASNYVDYHRSREPKKDLLASPLPKLPILPTSKLTDSSSNAAEPSENGSAEITDDAIASHLNGQSGQESHQPAAPLNGHAPKSRRDPASKPEWPEDLHRVRELLTDLNVFDEFDDPHYWQTLDQWIETCGYQIFYLDEFRAYLAHQAAIPAGIKGRHRERKRGFRNWLSNAITFRRRDAERKAANNYHRY